MKLVINEKTLPGDVETPVSLYLKLKDLSLYSFLLESVVGNEIVGRYSFIGIKPFLVFKALKKETINNRSVASYSVDGVESIVGITDDPFGVLQGLSEAEIVKVFGNPFEIPFYGGAVGYLSYDAIRYIEKIPDKNPDPMGLPEFYFVFPSILLCVDNISKLIKVISVEPILSYESDAVVNSNRKIEEVVEVIKSPLNIYSDRNVGSRPISWKSNFTKDEFVNMIEKSKKYIENGDIFQVVLSQRLSFNIDVDPFEVYRRLRMINPSPYMYHINFEDVVISGSSPEMLVKFWDGIVETRPIAGTRPRGKNSDEDRMLERELLSDQKELAEHVMLVDLGRNDIGRISEYGSVRVEEYMVVERYSHVMHIVSSVKGRARRGIKPIEIMKSVFPAGTVSGSPKIRAMEIIDKFENVRRGPYAGAVMYLGFNGNMDSAITLRSMVAKGNNAFVQAGAGVVYDSVPESEYFETLNKAKVVLKAVELASGGSI
ncbi:MAG: anthranilate synthase component I [Brevinematales bacterium]|nr:anthranilate synthase component I [Brevinematales bacterium]